jgi:hypothetical protein
MYQSMFLTPLYMRTTNNWINYIFSQILSGYPQPPYQPLQTVPVGYNNPPSNDIALKSYRPYLFFQLNNDEYRFEPKAKFFITLYVENQFNQLFASPFVVSLYKDRAGFMADAAIVQQGGRENVRHYFRQQVVLTDVSGVNIVFPVKNLQISYVIIRPLLANTISNLPLRIFCGLTETYGTYTQYTLEDTYDLPFLASTIYDQITPASADFKYPLTSIYDESIFRLGYDTFGVSNNLLDYFIQSGGNNYYDPTNMQYVMQATSASSSPPPSIASPQQWSLYFGSNTTTIRNLSTNIVYASTFQTTRIQTENEFSLVNWFDAGMQGSNMEPVERFYQTANIATNSTDTIFLPCINLEPLATDIVPTESVGGIYDTEGFHGVGLFLPPNQFVSMQSIVLKFAYTQPNSSKYNRSNPPLQTKGEQFQEATAYTNVATSPFASWDDWYASNRRNTKLGIFLASDIQNVSISSLSIFSSIVTLSLESLTQVNNFQNAAGTLRTREPDWGTYYNYTFQPNTRTVWDISDSWMSTIHFPDFAPSTNIGFNSYPNTFLTKHLENSTSLPRSLGIATAIANAPNPSPQDFANSYVAIPFSFDPIQQTWRVGNFQGVCYTRVPCLPPAKQVGAAPYYGPSGGYGWFAQNNVLVSDSNVYYWNANVRFHNLDVFYHPATDLDKFGGVANIEKEYQDTYLFVYDNPEMALKDITKTVTGEPLYTWGQESAGNYAAFDDQSGYNLLSYVHDFPVNANGSFAVNVRSYDPIPSMYTGLRIIGKNVTDFGSPTIAQIFDEISSLTSRSYVYVSDAIASTFVQNLYRGTPDASEYTKLVSTNRTILSTLNYSEEYANALVQFDRSFSTTTVFGRTSKNIGTQFQFQNFKDCFAQFSTVYTQFLSQFETTAAVFSTASAQLQSYAYSKYSNILPSFALARNNLSDPLPFQLLLSSYINPTYANQYDSWGLGYNLGFNKADTPVQPRTLVVSDTFIRLTHNYIYMKISPELNMNRLAVSNKENLAETHDPSAEDLKYFSKILLNDFASYCSAAVQQPIQFSPPLGKLDTISFQLVDKNGVQINNVDCEYDVVLEISEIKYGQKDNSALLKPATS